MNADQVLLQAKIISAQKTQKAYTLSVDPILGFISKQRTDQQDLINNLVKEWLNLGDAKVEEISLSTWWDCEHSPVKKCIYDSYNDPMLDHCLICGDPNERK